MSELAPFHVSFDQSAGEPLPLGETLARLYGALRFPALSGRPFIYANFVSTLDGVISLNVPGHASGGDISGFNAHDQALMGLLRAAAHAIIVGAAELRQPPGTRWLAGAIFPALAGEYAALRDHLGMPANPLQVIVTASGNVDASLPIFRDPRLPVLLLTSARGAQRLRGAGLPGWVTVEAPVATGWLTAAEILAAVTARIPDGRLLVEGGPRQMSLFLQERLLDALFLTLAPQVAGRSERSRRPGLAEGIDFAPQDPRWGTLASLRHAGDHLFTRYDFTVREGDSSHGNPQYPPPGNAPGGSSALT